MADDDLKLPKFLDRKLNGAASTPEERAAYAAKAAPPTADPAAEANASDAAIAQAMADDAEAKKKAKASNRIGRMIEKKAAASIPEKFRAWDTTRSRYYDTRKSNSAKETVMTATAKKLNGDKKVVPFFKPDRKKKPAAKGAAPTKKQTPKAAVTPTKKATKRDKLIQMLKRDNGASLAELLKANPLNGKTPLATISAMVSVLKRDFKVVSVGEGKGEHRRYRIVS